jgi:hypothetical protein
MEVEKFVTAVTPLNSDVDVAVAREPWRLAALPAGQLGRLDPNQHPTIIHRACEGVPREDGRRRVPELSSSHGD